MDTSVPNPPNHMRLEEFDEVCDVVVVGFGLAGGMAAVQAHDRGAKVILIEKMPDPGGISICAGGGVRAARDGVKARQYLKETTGRRVPDDVIDMIADGMLEVEGWLRDLAKVDGANIEVNEGDGGYPFPGYDAFYVAQVGDIPGFDPFKVYPHVRFRQRGPVLFRLIHDNVNHRGIDVRLSAAAERLIVGPDGAVRGLAVNSPTGRKTIAARKGVILACGGFEADPEMQAKYWRIQPVLPAAFLGNTGDGIRMAQALGADLWHVGQFHGCYGYKHYDPNYPFALRIKRLPNWTPGITEPKARMSWIILNKYGRRFMNEYEPYAQDTGHWGMDRFDFARQEFHDIPAYLVVDEEGRKLYPMGQAVLNDRRYKPYTWSDDNLAEVTNGILKKANNVAELANIIGCSEADVVASLDRWNAACERGYDSDFERPEPGMFPVKTPPFYVGEIWPLVSNTQGGPVHDARQRILNPFGEIIPRLYEAGELGSIWGHIYLGAGNLAECIITGKVAADDATALAPWDHQSSASAMV